MVDEEVVGGRKVTVSRPAFGSCRDKRIIQLWPPPGSLNCISNVEVANKGRNSQLLRLTREVRLLTRSCTNEFHLPLVHLQAVYLAFATHSSDIFH